MERTSGLALGIYARKNVDGENEQMYPTLNMQVGTQDSSRCECRTCKNIPHAAGGMTRTNIVGLGHVSEGWKGSYPLIQLRAPNYLCSEIFLHCWRILNREAPCPFPIPYVRW